jgi:hypothetical protein
MKMSKADFELRRASIIEQWEARSQVQILSPQLLMKS